MTTIGFMRPTDRMKESLELAKKMGFDAMCAPSLEILPGEDGVYEALERDLVPGAVAVFSSASAADLVRARLGDRLKPAFEGVRIVAIGPATAGKLREMGLEPDDVPEDHSSEGAVAHLNGQVSGKRVLLLRSDCGRDALSDGLRAEGADVEDLAVYRVKEYGISNGLLHIVMMIKQGRLDAMAFTSPKSAESFIQRIEGRFGREDARRYMSVVRIAAIGAPTAEKLEELGYHADIVPQEATFPAMLEAVRSAFPERRGHGPGDGGRHAGRSPLIPG